MSIFERVDEFSSPVDVSQGLADLAEENVREVVLFDAVFELVERNSFQLEVFRNVFDDVVGAAPVRPRLVQTVQVSGRLERADCVGCVRVGRSLR